MWPYSEWAHPTSSFNAPVPLPSGDPDEGDLVCVHFSREWQPYIAGALTQLLLQTTWRSTDRAAIYLAQKRASKLIEMMGTADEACSEIPAGDCCEEFTPEQGWITFAPQDPFSTPDLVPDGYLLPPFYHNAAIPLPGILPTDAMLNFLSFPLFQNIAQLLSTGLPRCRINVLGQGDVEIEFIRVPFGGSALVVVDDDLDQAVLVNTNQVSVGDLLALETLIDFALGDLLTMTEILELHIIGAGAHHIDVTFLPAIGGDEILGWGGGIRSIELCGAISAGDDVMPEMRSVPNGDDCFDIQWRPNSGASWSHLQTICNGENGADGEDGGQGPVGPAGQDGQDGQDCDCDQRGGDDACRSATAIIDNLYLTHLNPALNSIRNAAVGSGGLDQEVIDDALAAFGLPVTDMNLFVDWVTNLWNFERATIGDQIFPLIDQIENIVTVSAKCWLFCNINGTDYSTITRAGLIAEMYELSQTNTIHSYRYFADMLAFLSTDTINDILGANYAATTDYSCSGCANCVDGELEPLALEATSGTLTLIDGWWHAQVTFNGSPANFNVGFQRVGGGCFAVTQYELLGGSHGSAQQYSPCGGGAGVFTDAAGTLNRSVVYIYWRGNGGLHVRFKAVAL